MLYYVYILTNRSRVLYVGNTNHLGRRLWEHRHDRSPRSFTARYNLDQLVFYEVIEDPNAAIARETQIKTWSRQKKIKLIESMNPDWQDLCTHFPSSLDDLKKA